MLGKLLQRLRAVPDLVEKKPGVFYRKSRAYLHFHEDPAGLFADVRFAGDNFERFPVNNAQEQDALIERIRLAGLEVNSIELDWSRTMNNSDAPIHQGVVIFAKNKKKVSAFYRRTLDLEAFEEATSHDVLRGHGLEVVVHAIPRKIAAQIQITQPPQVREDIPIKPTFVVGSLDAVGVAAQATGGFLKPKEGAWHFRGATVLDGHDPEGNVVQFKEIDA